jgi:hypothetical protein
MTKNLSYQMKLEISKSIAKIIIQKKYKSLHGRLLPILQSFCVEMIASLAVMSVIIDEQLSKAKGEADDDKD